MYFANTPPSYGGVYRNYPQVQVQTQPALKPVFQPAAALFTWPKDWNWALYYRDRVPVSIEQFYPRLRPVFQPAAALWTWVKDWNYRLYYRDYDPISIEQFSPRIAPVHAPEALFNIVQPWNYRLYYRDSDFYEQQNQLPRLQPVFQPAAAFFIIPKDWNYRLYYREFPYQVQPLGIFPPPPVPPPFLSAIGYDYAQYYPKYFPFEEIQLPELQPVFQPAPVAFPLIGPYNYRNYYVDYPYAALSPVPPEISTPLPPQLQYIKDYAYQLYEQTVVIYVPIALSTPFQPDPVPMPLIGGWNPANYIRPDLYPFVQLIPRPPLVPQVIPQPLQWILPYGYELYTRDPGTIQYDQFRLPTQPTTGPQITFPPVGGYDYNHYYRQLDTAFYVFRPTRQPVFQPPASLFVIIKDYVWEAYYRDYPFVPYLVRPATSFIPPGPVATGNRRRRLFMMRMRGI